MLARTICVLISMAILMETLTVEAATCRGTPLGTNSDTPVTCVQDISPNTNLNHSQSCLYAAISENSNVECTGTCTEVNVVINADDLFSDSGKFVFSSVGCYSSQLDLTVCAADTTTTTTTSVAQETTTAASTSTSTASMTSTTAPTTAGPTTTAGQSSAAGSSDGTTTASLTTTTATLTTTTTAGLGRRRRDAAIHQFDGCLKLVGSMPNENCTAGGLNLEATLFYSANHADSTKVNVTVTVLGCCEEDSCRIDDGVTRNNLCRSGGVSAQSDVPCSSECFTYISTTGDQTEVRHGCLSDLVWMENSNFESVTVCDETTKDGVCHNDKTECLRCCDTDNCNTWNTVDALIGNSGISCQASCAWLVLIALLSLFTSSVPQ